MLSLLLSAKRNPPTPPQKDVLGTWLLKKATVSPGLTHMVAGVIRNEIYIYGGLSGGQATGRLIKYNSQTGVTTTLTSGLACHTPALVVYKGKLYAFGGNTGNASIATARSYDPVTDKWTTLTAMPAAHHGASHFVYNDKLYIVSGLNGMSFGASIYCYDPLHNTYTTIAIANTNARSAGCAFGMINNMFYMAGGQSGNNLLRAYDPATNTWYAGANLPQARKWAGGVVNNNKLYLYGGINTGLLGLGEMDQSTFYAYNPATNTWATLPPGTVAVSSYPMVVCYGRVYGVGPDVFLIE